MPRLQISTLNNTIESLTWDGYPVVGNGQWGEFRQLETLFPDIKFMGSTIVGSPGLKLSGENLPGRHGIYPVYSPVVETQKTFRFWVRKLTTEAETKNTIKNFATWLYNIGEFRLSIDDEAQYRRMKYNSGSDYEMVDGTYGKDGEFEMTLTCLDSISYNKNLSSSTMQLAVQYASINRFRYMYGFINNTNTIDFTPVTITFNYDPPAGVQPILQDSRHMIEVTWDGINRKFITFMIPGQPATPFQLVVDAERLEIYYIKDGVRTDLKDYIIAEPIIVSTVQRSYNYEGIVFPSVMSKPSYIGYWFSAVQGPSSSDPVSAFPTSAEIYYQHRGLAYD